MIPRYVLIALFIAFIEGFAPVIHKHVLERINPRTMVVVSSMFYTTCTILYAAYYWPEVSSDIKKISREDLGWIALTSTVTGFLANVLYYQVLAKHESHIVVALIYSSPVFTLFILYLFMNATITPFAALGVLCTTIGVICISVSKNSDKESFLILRE
jgi:uncharacterized membrane protein